MQKSDTFVSIPLWLAQELETDCEELAATYSGYDAGELYRTQARMLKAAIKAAQLLERSSSKQN